MTNKKQWFSEEAGFFGPDYLVEYDEVLPEERTHKEVDFLEKVLCLKKGTTILDTPCGHGRHSIELARRGYAVTGFELNQFFLSEARRAAEEAGVPISFDQGDMRELTYNNEFDVAVNMFTSMGYFDSDEDDVRFLSGIYNSLKSSGQFLLDYINNDYFLKNFKTKDVHILSNGSTLLTERVYDPIRRCKLESRIKIKDGVSEEAFETSLRLYTKDELIKMAESVGFIFKEAFGDFDGSPIGLTSKRTILRFKKK